MRVLYRAVLGRCALLLCCVAATTAHGQVTVVSTGAVWRYYAQGALAGNEWKITNYIAQSWPLGAAPLGYGDGDEATTIISGPEPYPLTTYYRHEFTLPDPTGVSFSSLLRLRLIRDDAAVVYINGFEVYRNNLPTGPIDSSTSALNLEEGEADRTVHQYAVSPFLLRPGKNVIAAEVHQHSSGLSDSRFDLELTGNLPLSLPEITITTPENGEVVDPGDLSIRVQVSDVDGYVFLVRYFANGQPIGSSYQEPFDFTWLSVPTGRYRLTAEAVDNSGRTRLSAPVYIQAGVVEGTEIIRGPYLQSGSTTGMVVRWRTDWPAGSAVRYGTAYNDLNRMALGEPGIDHEVALTDLLPSTRYYYAVGTAEETLPGGGGPGNTFVTTSLETRPIRIWAIGDSGTGNANAAAVRDAFLNVFEEGDVWLMLGDNAYESGTDDQYQMAVFDIYDSLLRRMPLWPTIGNHDASSQGVTEEMPYLEIFSLPRRGEAGGLASGTERYYSFDYANVHFVCLDAMAPAIGPGTPMLTWLENDLAATSQDWIVAFWHHPPYSWGTHNSDFENRLIEIRGHVVPILERFGVDLVLSGHSHVYERSFLLNGHYGLSSTLTAGMVLNSGLGSPLGAGAYRKPSGGLGANQGCVYVVCGCSGEGGYYEFPRHPAMAVNRAGFGSMVIEVAGLRMDVRFLTEEGGISDWFAIDKSGPSLSVRPALRARAAGNGIELSWPTSVEEFQLESAPGLGTSVPWDRLNVPVIQIGRQRQAWIERDGTNRIFRLRSDN